MKIYLVWTGGHSRYDMPTYLNNCYESKELAQAVLDEHLADWDLPDYDTGWYSHDQYSNWTLRTFIYHRHPVRNAVNTVGIQEMTVNTTMDTKPDYDMEQHKQVMDAWVEYDNEKLSRKLGE